MNGVAALGAALTVASWLVSPPAAAEPTTTATASADGSAAEASGPPATEPNSEPLRNAGIALTVLGPLVAGLGAALFLTHMDVGGTSSDDRPVMLTGVVMMPVGAALMLGGIPMWIVGAWEVPIAGRETARAPARSSVRDLPGLALVGRF